MSEPITYRCEICDTECVDSDSIYYYGDFRLCSKCYNTSKEELDKRIFDCVKACRSIPTAALEAGIVEKMVGLVKTASEGYQNKHKQVDLEVVLEGKTKEIIKLLEGKK